jgi:hypothetical protein
MLGSNLSADLGPKTEAGVEHCSAPTSLWLYWASGFGIKRKIHWRCQLDLSGKNSKKKASSRPTPLELLRYIWADMGPSRWD